MVQYVCCMKGKMSPNSVVLIQQEIFVLIVFAIIRGFGRLVEITMGTVISAEMSVGPFLLEPNLLNL